jgi:hypothetical protein
MSKKLQGHIVTGSITSMKNSNETIGNRTRDLPGCSVVPTTNCATSSVHQIFK